MDVNRLNADVVVVGAGVIGASVSYHLARTGLRVVTLEAFDGPAEGSTGRSFASIRAQWADSLNIEIAWRSIQQYRNFLGQHGRDIGYRPSGYLLLVEQSAWRAQLEAVERQRAHGVPVEVLDISAAQAITPFDPTGIGGATWGPADGVVDPHLVATAYLDLARAHDARTLFGRRVTAVNAESDGGWTVVAGSSSVRSQYVVNAAGGWAGEVAALAGIPTPVVHSRRNIYATAAGALHGSLPMTIDVATGVYLRSEGTRLLFAGARPDQLDGYDITVDWPWMEMLLGQATVRFPWLADLPLDRAACWSGTYAKAFLALSRPSQPGSAPAGSRDTA